MVTSDAAAAPRFVSVSVGDRLDFFLRVVVPTWSKGILLRRRAAMTVAARFDLDRQAVRCIQRLRRRYGEGPLLLRNPGRPQFLVLDPGDMARVLNGAPQPFTPATVEKRAALAHFEPHNSLVTRGPERPIRRQFNDEVLQSACVVHDLAEAFATIVRDEARRLLAAARSGGTMTWPMFTEAWYRAVRRIVLGEAAGEDRDLTEQLARLRASANWVLFPQLQNGRRVRYRARLASHLARAEPGSLAAVIARRPARDGDAPLDQITQWLFAFDGGGMTAFRALGLLATHPQAASDAAADVESWRSGQHELPYLRAVFLDTVRLWPTTPVILRETTVTTPFSAGSLPKGAGLIIYVPYFNRDTERSASADRFAPDFWIGRDPAAALPFVPFSAGPAACPGRHLVTLIGSVWLAALLDESRIELLWPKQLGPQRPLPGTLDHFAMAFVVS